MASEWQANPPVKTEIHASTGIIARKTFQTAMSAAADAQRGALPAQVSAIDGTCAHASGTRARAHLAKSYSVLWLDTEPA